MILDKLVTYLLIGAIFTFLVDSATRTKIFKVTNKTSKYFSNTERIICILIWPITLSVFLYAFIKTYFSKE